MKEFLQAQVPLERGNQFMVSRKTHTKPSGLVSEQSNQDNFVEIVEASQGSEESKPMSLIHPGATIQYRIPRIVSPANYDWEWHSGKIERVDERWQMVLVIPATESEPWLWVSMTYIKTEGGA